MTKNIAMSNMIEQQIRPWEVFSPDVIRALSDIDRANFVTGAQKKLAYVDIRLPLGHGEFMLEPKLDAKIMQSVNIKKTENVLEVGTGSGYMTALLAYLSKSVLSLEIIPEIGANALKNINSINSKNTTLRVSDALANRFLPDRPIDVAVLTGGVYEVPENILNGVCTGGRIFAFIVDDNGIATATVMHKISENSWHYEEIFETVVPMLKTAKTNVSDSFNF